jgi:hypothetical protein
MVPLEKLSHTLLLCSGAFDYIFIGDAAPNKK